MWWVIGLFALPVVIWLAYVAWRIYRVAGLSAGDDDEDFKPFNSGKT